MKSVLYILRWYFTAVILCFSASFLMLKCIDLYERPPSHHATEK